MHNHKPEQDLANRIKRNKGWLPLGSALTVHVNEWAGSRDLVLYLGDDGAADLGKDAATAFYNPVERFIEISAQFAFGKGVRPAHVDAEACTTKKGLSNYPILGGLAMHESMHARHTTVNGVEIYDMLVADYGKNVGSQVTKIYTLMEETRIEGRGVSTYPEDKGFLRASARKLAEPKPAAPGAEPGEPDIVTTLLLIVMREPIGVLTKKDTGRLRKALEKQITAATVRSVQDALEVFWRTNDTSVGGLATMRGRAKEVYDLLSPHMTQVEMPYDGHGEKPENGESQEIASPDGEGAEGDPSGSAKPVEGTEGNGKLSDEAAKAAEDAMDSAERGGADDVWNEQAKQERERQSQAAKENAKEQDVNDKKSKNTFERSFGGDGRTKSRIVSERPPTAEERRSMVTFMAALQDAKHRDRKVGVTRSVVPPGRLQTNAALRDEAHRAAGGAAGHIEMFKGKRRTHVDDPNLTVGIICDISGSMSGTMEPMAVSTWIMANSVNRIPGSTVASVYFGETVFPTLWPGQRLDKVTRYNANDGYEEFDAAFRSVDGKLKLLSGSGVRLLVVTSDGNYRSHEEKAARKWLAKCKAAGVGVLWLGLKSGAAEGYINDMGPGGEFVDISKGVVQATGAISAAALRALRGY